MTQQRVPLQGLSLQELADAISNNQLILVPNNRLRNGLLAAYARQQVESVWVQPRIMTLDQWADSCWAQLQQMGYEASCVNVVSKWQRLWWWETIIRDAPQSSHLTNVRSLAQLADSTYQNLERWALVDDFLAQTFLDPSSNAAQFQAWINGFQTKLLRTKMITREQKLAVVVDAFAKSFLSSEPRIYLEGFDEIYPLGLRLIDSAADDLVSLPMQSAEQSFVVKTSAKNTEAEIRAAACWAVEALKSQGSAALIGIVVPNLGQCRQLVERIFVEEFESYSFDPLLPRYTMPFNFSAGVPLGKQPLIENLLLPLGFHRQSLAVEDVVAFLNTPFWGVCENEITLRAFSCQTLNELERRTVSFGEVISKVAKLEQSLSQSSEHASANEGFENNFLAVSKRLELMAQWFRRLPKEQSLHDWLVALDEFTASIGWPGSRPLDSVEYQQFQALLRVREELFCLSESLPSVTYTDFIRIFKDLLDTTPFQPQTPQSPIQILGALEAAGLRFSHLWVMGLNDTQWPAVPSPSSLIPVEYQRIHNLPKASATREYEMAKLLTHRYLHCAEQVVLSYSHTEGDNELRESALIRQFPETSVIDIAVSASHANLQAIYARLMEVNPLVVCDDAFGPQLGENEKVRGGSSLFKLQAACPFEAFVRLRLGAKSHGEPSLGFSPADRGNILHECLARFWREVQDSDRLRLLQEQEISKMLQSICEDVVRYYQTKSGNSYGNTYCELEVARLVDLLSQWLSDEKFRSPFKVVAIEQSIDCGFAGLELRLRVDRIDEVLAADGSKSQLVIDYKTGSASRKSWQLDRFSEPQLPLYAVINDQVSGISFAVINRKRMAWEGLAEVGFGPLGLDGISPSDSWTEQLQQWKIKLEELAQAFTSGDAVVSYADNKAKEYASDLLPLNRLLDQVNVNNLKVPSNSGGALQ